MKQIEIKYVITFEDFLSCLEDYDNFIKDKEIPENNLNSILSEIFSGDDAQDIANQVGKFYEEYINKAKRIVNSLVDSAKNNLGTSDIKDTLERFIDSATNIINGIDLIRSQSKEVLIIMWYFATLDKNKDKFIELYTILNKIYHILHK